MCRMRPDASRLSASWTGVTVTVCAVSQLRAVKSRLAGFTSTAPPSAASAAGVTVTVPAGSVSSTTV